MNAFGLIPYRQSVTFGFKWGRKETFKPNISDIPLSSLWWLKTWGAIGGISVRTNNFVHGLDRTVGIADEGALTVHVADLYEPRLGGPAVGCGRMLVEHRGSIVHLGTTFRTFICDKTLDCGTHPSRFSGTIGLQLGNPPVFIGIFVVSQLVCRLLWPVAFILDIGGETDLEGTHICHAPRRLRSHWQTIRTK